MNLRTRLKIAVQTIILLLYCILLFMLMPWFYIYVRIAARNPRVLERLKLYLLTPILLAHMLCLSIRILMSGGEVRWLIRSVEIKEKKT